MNKIKKHIEKSSIIPRYTSYPTAPHFNEDVDSNLVNIWYNNLHKKVDCISLYVHIPFCEKLCLFCACNMKIVNTYDPVQQYLDLLEKEISLISKAIKNCPHIKHLHFGGGSPTALKGVDFRKLMAVLKKHFPIDEQTDISVEIDPRTVDDEKMTSYTDCGMNRISVGVQDFNEQVQQSVNRVQPYDLIKLVIDKLKKQGVESINIDIMYGLPFQTLKTLDDTLDKILSLSPDRLSVFGYAHVPWMKAHQKLIPEEVLPSITLRLQMYEKIKNYLVNNGYKAIGLDHFAKDTDVMVDAFDNRKLNRNFQGYTTDTANALIGIGHSSIGYTPDGYMQNYLEPQQYKKSLEDGDLPIKKGFAISDIDIFRRNIINDIMCYMEVDLKNYNDNWNSFFNDEISRLGELLDDDLIQLDNGIITIPDTSRSLIRIVASVFDTYLNNGKGKHSSAI